MFAERPSSKKVVGVSRRYLKHVEKQEAANGDTLRYLNEDLSMFEASRIAYSIGYSAVAGVFKEPLQIARRRFLFEEQQAEGLKPGEENIVAYALSRAQNPDAYPLTLRAVQDSLQD